LDIAAAVDDTTNPIHIFLTDIIVRLGKHLQSEVKRRIAQIHRILTSGVSFPLSAQSDRIISKIMNSTL
jgi:hypothetical protein